MPDEIFDDEIHQLAMALVEGNRDDSHTYASIEKEHVTFECVSADNQAFIHQKITRNSRLYDFILPYQAFYVDDLILEHQHDVSRSSTECLICGEPTPDGKYLYNSLHRHAHQECAEEYNSALRELNESLKPHDEEIKSKIVSVNV